MWTLTTVLPRDTVTAVKRLFRLKRGAGQMRRPVDEADARVARALKEEVARLGALIGASERELVSFSPADAAQPFVWVGDDGAFNWCVVERGKTLEHRITANRDELLYWAFAGTMSEMSSRWAARHPRDGEEFRVTMWARQFSLLNGLNPTWARRRRDELVDYLRRAQPESLSLIPALPLSDGNHVRADP